MCFILMWVNMLELTPRYHDFILASNISMDVRTGLYVTCTLPVSLDNIYNSYSDQRILYVDSLILLNRLYA